MRQKKGFTLIELLIVIGILAILAIATVLVLNPAEILKQSRDSKRISDLKTLRGAIDLYLSTAGSSATLNIGTTECTLGTPGTTHTWHASAEIAPGSGSIPNQVRPFQNPVGAAGSVPTAANLRKVDGTGWVPITFSTISLGSPISKLPIDPVNAINNNDLSGTLVVGNPAGLFYAYQCYGLTYEINANMESQKFSATGSNDVESTDGGQVGCNSVFGCNQTIADLIYEVGNDPGLNL
jgi:prepilin-type N-terminal cleavage/methylation domain-containing protein